MCTVKYWQRLQRLEIYSLQRRRERYLLIILYKMVAGIQEPIGFTRGHICFSDRRNITITPVMLKTMRKRQWVQTLRYNAFAAMAIILYNLLPGELRLIFTSTDLFKTRLDAWLASVPDEPDCANLRTAAPSNKLEDQKNCQRRNFMA